MEFEVIGYIAIGILLGYAALRMLAARTIKRNIDAEFEEVLTSDESKVKGRYE